MPSSPPVRVYQMMDGRTRKRIDATEGWTERRMVDGWTRERMMDGWIGQEDDGRTVGWKNDEW